MIYIIGSLAGPKVEEVADRLRDEGFSVFDQWRAAHGDYWADYAKRRKMSFREALAMDFTETAFQFDLKHLQKADSGVLVMPAGRSAGIELGWMLGQGKNGYILYDGEPERPDLMAKLATEVCFSVGDLIDALHARGEGRRQGLNGVGVLADRDEEAIQRGVAVLRGRIEGGVSQPRLQQPELGAEGPAGGDSTI